jgi:hypothetical protein
MILYTDIIFTEDNQFYYDTILSYVDYSDIYENGELVWEFENLE